MAQSKKDSVWILSPSGCKIYNPNPQKNETITWSGSCVDGYAHGEGALEWLKNGKPNQLYVGGMKRGAPHGKGKYDYGNGTTREGEYSRGDLNGIGTILTKNKKGIVTYYFHGSFIDDEANGYGEEIDCFGDGDTITISKGIFRDSKLNGKGQQKEFNFNKTITVVHGTFNNGYLEGQAEISEYNKNKLVLYYSGEFRNKGRNGQGKEVQGHVTYTGQWEGNKKSGRGLLFLDSMMIYDGDWKNDEFHGEGKRVFFDSSFYVGEFNHGKRSGFGVMLRKDGTKYIGEFKDDLYQGLGCVIQDTKIISSGRWEKGRKVATDTYLNIRKQLKTKYGIKFDQAEAAVN